jgi:hypothetical protein
MSYLSKPLNYHRHEIEGERGPDHQNEKNDCTVRAIATAASMPYSAAHEE